jgi:urease accessory protein UreG
LHCANSSEKITTSVRLFSFKTRLYVPLYLLPATVTNDIFTREDQEFLIRNKALPPARILAIETGGCPHAAIREDISANMGALETLQAKFACQMLFVESGGDNLAANYSRELADYIIYVIDVSVSAAITAKEPGDKFYPTNNKKGG